MTMTTAALHAHDDPRGSYTAASGGGANAEENATEMVLDVTSVMDWVRGGERSRSQVEKNWGVTTGTL